MVLLVLESHHVLFGLQLLEILISLTARDHETIHCSYTQSPYTVSLLYLQVLQVGIQPTLDGKYLGEKKNSRKQNLNLLHTGTIYLTLHCICNYLHSIYTVFDIVSNLEIT